MFYWQTTMKEKGRHLWNCLTANTYSIHIQRHSDCTTNEHNYTPSTVKSSLNCNASFNSITKVILKSRTFLQFFERCVKFQQLVYVNITESAYVAFSFCKCKVVAYMPSVTPDTGVNTSQTDVIALMFSHKISNS